MTPPKPDKRAWESAGFEFRKPLCAVGLESPLTVRRQGPNLVFDYYGDPSEGVKVVPTAKMLRHFLRLGRPRVRATRYVEFAKEWGPLGICQHGIAGYHGRFEESGGSTALVWCPPHTSIGLRTTEPIAAWRRTAGAFVALLNAAAAVSQGRRTEAGDWRALYEDIDAESKLPPQTLQAGRYEVARILGTWMIRGDVRLRVEWLKDDAPSIAIGGSGLAYGALVAQLALVVSGAEGLLLCSHCRVPFSADRKPPRGTKTYCQDCGPKAPKDASAPASRRVALRDAQRAVRSDRREAKRLRGLGMPIEKVCERFPNRKAETVRNWLSKGTPSNP